MVRQNATAVTASLGVRDAAEPMMIEATSHATQLIVFVRQDIDVSLVCNSVEPNKVFWNHNCHAISTVINLVYVSGTCTRAGPIHSRVS
jgi:hypothetical protein